MSNIDLSNNPSTSAPKPNNNLCLDLPSNINNNDKNPTTNRNNKLFFDYNKVTTRENIENLENISPIISSNNNNCLTSKSNNSFNSFNFLNLNDNILSVPEKCRRCQSKPPEVMCQDCYPFLYFCRNCNISLHSMDSKRNHNVISLKELNQEIFNEVNNNNNYCVESNSNRANNINNNNLNDLISNLDSENSICSLNNYVSEIKNIYDKEKYSLMQKNLLLSKNLENTRQSYDERINELVNKINLIENSKNSEIQKIKEGYEYERNCVLEENKSKIDMLINRNEELAKFNEDLVSKISTYKGLINNTNLNTSQLIEKQNEEIAQLKKDKNELIKYYEKKINFLNQSHDKEKNDIIKNYNQQIEKISSEYKTNKEKLKSMLEEREKEIALILNEHRNNISQLNRECEEVKYKNKVKDKEQQDLITKVLLQEKEIEDLNNKLDMKEKECTMEFNEKNKLKKKNKELNVSNKKMKGDINYLNRLTRGTKGKFMNIDE